MAVSAHRALIFQVKILLHCVVTLRPYPSDPDISSLVFNISICILEPFAPLTHYGMSSAMFDGFPQLFGLRIFAIKR